MRADELKEYISENGLIATVLESLGCHKIKEYDTEFRAALPGKSNGTALCVKKDTLSMAIRTEETQKKGDIFTLVMELKGCGFSGANKYLHELFKLDYRYAGKKDTKKHADPLAIFKKVTKQRHIVNRDIQIYDDELFEDYIDIPHISWVREGIMPFACKRFGIGYSYDRKRIIIPHRYWCGEENEFLGAVGRTTIPEYEMFDIPKYLAMPPFPKGENVYGLQENYKSIIEAGYVNVFESEKSVLKRYSRKDDTGVAISGSELTDTQVKILISLNVDIVMIFDEGITLEHIYKECSKFKNIRNVYYIYDRWSLLKSKESPADKPDKVFRFMWKYKEKFDSKAVAS